MLATDSLSTVLARRAFTTSTLAVGTHPITATFNGTTNFATSASDESTQTVNQIATTTALASSLNPSTFGQA